MSSFGFFGKKPSRNKSAKAVKEEPAGKTDVVNKSQREPASTFRDSDKMSKKKAYPKLDLRALTTPRSADRKKGKVSIGSPVLVQHTGSARKPDDQLRMLTNLTISDSKGGGAKGEKRTFGRQDNRRHCVVGNVQSSNWTGGSAPPSPSSRLLSRKPVPSWCRDSVRYEARMNGTSSLPVTPSTPWDNLPPPPSDKERLHMHEHHRPPFFYTDGCKQCEARVEKRRVGSNSWLNSAPVSRSNRTWLG